MGTVSGISLNTPSRHKDLLTPSKSGAGFGPERVPMAQQAEVPRPPSAAGGAVTPLPQGGSQGRQASGAGIPPSWGELRSCQPPDHANRHLPLLWATGSPEGGLHVQAVSWGSAVWREAQGWGQAAAEAGSDHPPLSRAVVEVTGHAHYVLLAAFEKE